MRKYFLGIVCVGSIALLGAGTSLAAEVDERCEILENAASGRLAACLSKVERFRVNEIGWCQVTEATECHRDGDCPDGEHCVKDPRRYNEKSAACEERFRAAWEKIESRTADAGGTCPSNNVESVDTNDVPTLDPSCFADPDDPASAIDPNCLVPVSNLPSVARVTFGQIGADYLAQQAKSQAIQVSALVGGKRYLELYDGTILDAQTGLVWEKKDDSGGLHDQDNRYTWRSQSVIAPLWAKASEGVSQPRVCRGRALSSAATSSS